MDIVVIVVYARGRRRLLLLLLLVLGATFFHTAERAVNARAIRPGDEQTIRTKMPQLFLNYVLNRRSCRPAWSVAHNSAGPDLNVAGAVPGMPRIFADEENPEKFEIIMGLFGRTSRC